MTADRRPGDLRIGGPQPDKPLSSTSEPLSTADHRLLDDFDIKVPEAADNACFDA